MKLLCALLFSALLSGQILSPIVAGGGSSFTLTATTASSSQVVTIQRLTLNGAQILSWGDGQSTTITSGSTGTWPHTYASAGTYTITLPNARGIVGLQLQDAKLGALKTSQLRQSSLNYFYVTAITASTISSADMSAWRPTTWELVNMPAGTYTISSADMSAWRPTTWYLAVMPAGGTYTISSADMSAWRPTTWALASMPAGTYTISSADISAWRPTTWDLFIMPAGGTYTISSADMSAWRPTAWQLASMPAGTYTISSADMSAWRPTNWYLYNLPTGTYTISSADMSAWRPANWYLYSMPAGGTYTISSADMSAWRPTTWELFNMPAGGTYTISSADMSVWTGITTLDYYSMPSAITVTANTLSTQVAMTTLNLSNDALAAAAVNQVLADLVTSISGRGGVKCITTLNGTNAAPTGTGITNKATLVTAGWTVTTN